MFNNYTIGTHSSSNCDCTSNKYQDIITTVSDYSIEDKYGNLERLTWAPNSRFTINLTSDMYVPVALGSKVLTVEGATPNSMAGSDGTYAYNTVDCKCWKYIDNSWIEQEDIAEFPNSSTVISFSNKNCITRVIVKNFRGESILTVENDSNVVNFVVDDTVANILKQGYYNVDIYKIANGNTLLVRRVPLSIGYESNPTNVHTSHKPLNSGFTTDDTLLFNNGILSVNTVDGCYYGSTLPVTAGAVADYAQPKNIEVQINSNNYASISSIDIQNQIMSGGNVICVYENNRYDFRSADESVAKFSYTVVEKTHITVKTIHIDKVGKATFEESTFKLEKDTTNEDLLDELQLLKDSHTTDINALSSDIDNILSRLEGVENSFDTSGLESKIEVLRTQLNSQTDRIVSVESYIDALNTYAGSLQTQVDQLSVSIENKVSKDEVSDVVEESINTETLKDIVSNIIDNTSTYDGGVIE